MFGLFTITKEPKLMTIIRGAIVGVVGIVFIVLGCIDIAKINAKPIDLNETHMDWNQLHNGQHVEMDVNVLIGQYMYTTENGSEVSRDYLMPHMVYDSHNDRYYVDRVIGVKVNKSSGDFDTAEAIVDNTVDFFFHQTEDYEFNTVTIHVDGYLQKLDDDQMKYVKQAMEAAGFTPHDIAAMIVPYYICDNSSSGPVLLGIGIFCLLLGAGVALYGYKKKVNE